MHPDQIGPYRIDQKIGAGGMGNVYRGTHTETGHVVAVKVLPASLAREPGFIERFTREIEALRKLKSRHIVELFDDGSTPDGSCYFAMEFVDGETLTSLIARQKRIPWQEVTDYTLQIAAALKAAHDAGIVHRDIKPSNLMVTEDGNIKLTDFGVAHIFATTRLTRTGGVVGTAEYMSPEQARGQRATKRSDLYSLGAVMYAMLTGRPAFTGNNANEILHKQQFAQIEKPRHYVPDIPRLFEDLVCKLLEKKPEHRIPDALVLSRKLEQVRSRIDFTEQQRKLPLEQQVPASTDEAEDTHSQTAPGGDYHGPGPATIVRNLMRQEVASQPDKSAIGRFFDNTFVLIVMFILVIGLGYYLTKNASLTDEERLAEAEAILQKEASPAWFRARETFKELVQKKSMADRAPELQRKIHHVNNYEFCRSLGMTTPVIGTRDSEIQRLIRKAFARFASGEIVQARAELQSIRHLVNNSLQDQYLGIFIQQTLDRWEEDTSLQGRKLVIQEIIAEAMDSRPNAADYTRELLQAAETLYGDDPAVADLVAECRQMLKELKEKQPPPAQPQESSG
jgi:hypothetical protein